MSQPSQIHFRRTNPPFTGSVSCGKAHLREYLLLVLLMFGMNLRLGGRQEGHGLIVGRTSRRGPSSTHDLFVASVENVPACWKLGFVSGLNDWLACTLFGNEKITSGWLLLQLDVECDYKECSVVMEQLSNEDVCGVVNKLIGWIATHWNATKAAVPAEQKLVADEAEVPGGGSTGCTQCPDVKISHCLIVGSANGRDHLAVVHHQAGRILNCI
jgi:hypothetical protein